MPALEGDCIAVGPKLDLDGPPPVAPLHSLLQTAGVVVEEGAGHWLNGANVRAYPEDVPSPWDPLSEGTYRNKGEGTGQTTASFDPFVCYVPITCSSLGVYQDLQGQAEAVLEATYSGTVEAALANGIFGSANPYFGDANLDILASGAAVSPGAALSYLENAIGATGRVGMIHATPAVVAALQAFPLGANDSLVTANGTLVVSGDGYIAADPDAGATPTDGQDWIFATGPVQVRLGPVVMTDVAETLDRSDNTLTFRAERYVLAYWDTVLQAGVLVDWDQ